MLFRLGMIGLCLLAVTESALAQKLVTPEFDGARAFSYLESICAIGPRISGTPGMQKQQELIEKHFTSLGATVFSQDFDAVHPKTGEPVRMKNLIISWQPQAPRRVLVCCHYDTRPRPDREPVPAHQDLPFIGANDGGSGVALMMELGNQLAKLPVKPAVDFVIFDGEELVYEKTDKYFIGSEHFARAYRDRSPEHPQYTKGVLLDMVAGKNAQFFYELNSLKYAPEVTREVWDTARRLGIREFKAVRKHEVLDDHLPLNQIAGIPTCDVIDFDYPHWHRRNDLPAACSPVTLTKVGRVISAWIAAQ
ncbi:MAG TPA: M28 family peptidase [Planctomicrobium sp.]|nr:M28 family peptidase [Planctomicrobium sp.]